MGILRKKIKELISIFLMKAFASARTIYSIYMMWVFLVNANHDHDGVQSMH